MSTDMYNFKMKVKLANTDGGRREKEDRLLRSSL